jgi:hypothetical protein
MKITAWVALVVRESRTAETKSMSADRLGERVSGPHISERIALAQEEERVKLGAAPELGIGIRRMGRRDIQRVHGSLWFAFWCAST